MSTRALNQITPADIYQEEAPVFEFDVRWFDVGKYRPEK
jgi:hypothetical protein